MKSLTTWTLLFFSVYGRTKALKVAKYGYKEGANISVKFAAAGIHLDSYGYMEDHKTGGNSYFYRTSDLDEPNITLFVKKISIERFEDDWPPKSSHGLVDNLSNSKISWLFPGQFGVGAKLEIKFEIPEALYMKNSFYLSIPSRMYNDITMAEIAILKSGGISIYYIVKSAINNKLAYVNVLSTGKTYSAVFELNEYALKVSVDGETAVTEIPYLTSPQDAADRVLIIFRDETRPLIKEIVFAGNL